MKKIFPLLAVLVFLFSSTGIANAAIFYPDGYNIVAKSDNPVIAPGEQTILWTTLENTGSVEWYADWTDQQFCGNGWCDTPDPIRLGTIRPQDRSSSFYTSNNWLSTNRVHVADQDKIGRNETINFGFYITAPPTMANGMYTECFAPVIEGSKWLEDKGLCWDIKVDGQAKNYNASIEHVIGGSYKKLLLEAGTEETVSFEFKNTGSTTWYRDGAYPIRLAFVNDRPSSFYHSSWLSMNRPAELVESSVAPGQYGHFEFKVQSYDYFTVGNSHKEELWLVAENHSWFHHDNFDPYVVLEVETIESKENQDMVYDMLAEMITQNSMSADINYSMATGQSDIDLNVYMEIDNIDPDNSVTNSNIDLTLNDYTTKETYEFGMQMRQSGEDLSYIKLDVADLEKLDITDLDEIDQQWIKIDQEEIRQKLTDSVSDIEDIYTINEGTDKIDQAEIDKIRKALKYSGALVVTEDIDSESINSHASKHLKVRFDDEQFADAITQAKLYNRQNQFLDNYSACGLSNHEANINCSPYIPPDKFVDLWIGSGDKLLYKLIYEYDDLGEFSSMEVYLDNYGQRFDFVEPDEYITLDDLDEIYKSVMSASPVIQSAMESIAKR